MERISFLKHFSRLQADEGTVSAKLTLLHCIVVFKLIDPFKIFTFFYSLVTKTLFVLVHNHHLIIQVLTLIIYRILFILGFSKLRLHIQHLYLWKACASWFQTESKYWVAVKTLTLIFRKFYLGKQGRYLKMRISS